MSKQRALKALRLQATDRIPCQETLDHPEFIQARSGLDPYVSPAEAFARCAAAVDLDWVIGVPSAARKFAGGQDVVVGDGGRKYTNWGLAGSEWQTEYAFSSVEEVLAFDPNTPGAEHVSGVPGDSYSRLSVATTARAQALLGETTLVTGLYYTLLFQFFIMVFGWEIFLETAASEPTRFREVIRRFTDFSQRRVAQWVVESDCPVFFCHDDIAIQRGPVFHPDWYRRELFPFYEAILSPAKEAGKIIIFVSDGNYGELVPDLFALGVDGVMIDCTNDLEDLLARYGEHKVVVGNMDTRIPTYGTVEEVEAEVRRCATAGRHCPGYFFKMAGDLPQNIPMRNLNAYFDACRRLGQRG